MEEGDDASASSAVSEALGGHGLGRQRKIPALQPRGNLPQRAPVAGASPPFPGIGSGPAPFVSPRHQPPHQQVAALHPTAGQGFRSGVANITGLGVDRSGLRSPPRHTAVTIEEGTPAQGNLPSDQVPPTSPLRFRAPPLSIDTSPGPHRNHPVALSQRPLSASGNGNRLSDATPPAAGRRRTPSAAISHIPGGLRSPKRGPGVTGGQRSQALPPPSALLSSVFLRRKPPQKPPSPSHEPGANLVSAGSSHQVMFFQDTDSETSSQHPRSSNGDSVNSRRPHDTTESSRSTHDSSGKDEHRDVTDATAPPSSSGQPFKEHRKRQTSHAQPTGIEKLGELSREEEAYDFAILLKSSKFEEHLEIALPTTNAATDDVDSSKAPLHRAASDVHSLATSANGAVDDITGNPIAEPAADTATSPVTFKLPGTPRSQLRKQKNDPASARAAIIERITHTGLQVKRLLSLDGRQTLLKVKAPQLVLEMGAERMKLRKLRKFDQIWMEFSCEVRETFADFDSKLGGVKFIDSEKQCIVHSLLTSDVSQGGAGLNEYCPLKSKYVLKMFPLHKHDDLMSLRNHWVTYWRSAADGEEPSSCGVRAKRLTTHALHQPIDQVAQYYGERVAYYFAWMEMYTRWLIVPSVAGVLLFILQVQSKTLDHPLASPYAIFIALWTSAFLIAWKRRAASLAYRWGTLGYEDGEITRPEFYGDPSVSTDTIKKYPAWKRYVKYAITVPTVVTGIVLVMVLTLYAFSVRDRLEAQSIAVKAKAKDLAKDIAADLQHGLTLENFKRLGELGMDWDFWFYFLITPILYGLLIPVLDYAFTKYARRMTNWENHQTETHYQSHLILKVFSFRFVHVFASLYYYAFTNSSNAGNSLLRVAVQLASFMITDQLWRNSMQTLYPFVMRRLQVQRKKKATNAQFHQSTVFNGGSSEGGGLRMRGRHRSRHGSALYHNGGVGAGAAYNSNAVIHEQCVRLEQASDHAWEEAELEQYDTFEDYTEMLIQFGYVTFFSLAFPLAPLLALVNNVFELRMDAFKLCHAKQRPLAQKASGIGIWFHVLQLMSVLAVLTNCLHIAFTTTLIERLYPGVTPTHKVWVVFCVEHLILALKVWMMVVIPSMPSEVNEKVRREREHAKIESARAMAAKIQSQQEQLRLQEQELHRQRLDKQLRAEEDAKVSSAEAELAEGVRRRSRASSSETGGLRAAQAVLEA